MEEQEISGLYQKFLNKEIQQNECNYLIPFLVGKFSRLRSEFLLRILKKNSRNCIDFLALAQELDITRMNDFESEFNLISACSLASVYGDSPFTLKLSLKTFNHVSLSPTYKVGHSSLYHDVSFQVVCSASHQISRSNV